MKPILFTALLLPNILWSQVRSIEESAALMASNYREVKPMDALALHQLDLDEALSLRGRFVTILADELGPVIGYKAALTSKPAQDKFGVDHPILGMLLGQSLKPSPARFEKGFAFLPMVEGDFLLVVGDGAINEATTIEEVAQHISHGIPFLEVPDLMFEHKKTLNGAALAAINAGVRSGVTGPRQAWTPQQLLEDLPKVQVVLYDETGRELTRGSGSAILGHPLKAVLWIRDQCDRQGIRLEKGHILSLGSMTRLVPFTPGSQVRATYTGLPNQESDIHVLATYQ